MYSNIGKRIQTFSIVVGIVSGVLTVISALFDLIEGMSYCYYSTSLFSILIDLAINCTIIIFVTMLSYGIGRMIENSEVIRYKMTQMVPDRTLVPQNPPMNNPYAVAPYYNNSSNGVCEICGRHSPTVARCAYEEYGAVRRRVMCPECMRNLNAQIIN